MQHSTRQPRSVMTIAGSDSGGGAGIQADLRTIAAHGLHGTSAITAITAQNTRGVIAIHACPPAVVRAQIDALFDDFDIAAVKIGMLASAELIGTVADALAAHPPCPVVLDPVMVASSGARLLAADALQALIERLFPRATVVTPNLPEAALLLGRELIERDGMAAAARALQSLGASAVLLKGGHLGGDVVLDHLQLDDRSVAFEHPRLALEGHGTGCTLSSAIACGLAIGQDLEEACRAACDYVHGALQAAAHPGSAPLAVLGHFWRWDIART
jgi:hydroxymethylpyrimidine/phosphomethylpyrimidine kinase